MLVRATTGQFNGFRADTITGKYDDAELFDKAFGLSTLVPEADVADVGAVLEQFSQIAHVACAVSFETLVQNASGVAMRQAQKRAFEVGEALTEAREILPAARAVGLRMSCDFWTSNSAQDQALQVMLILHCNAISAFAPSAVANLSG